MSVPAGVDIAGDNIYSEVLQNFQSWEFQSGCFHLVQVPKSSMNNYYCCYVEGVALCLWHGVHVYR